MTIGPRTLKTLENGPKSEYMGGGHCTWTESHRDFARRVALIAHAEGLAAGARAQREMEPTEAMFDAGCLAVKDIYAKEGGWCGVRAAKDQVAATWDAMQRVAPLVGGEG